MVRDRLGAVPKASRFPDVSKPRRRGYRSDSHPDDWGHASALPGAQRLSLRFPDSACRLACRVSTDVSSYHSRQKELRHRGRWDCACRRRALRRDMRPQADRSPDWVRWCTVWRVPEYNRARWVVLLWKGPEL